MLDQEIQILILSYAHKSRYKLLKWIKNNQTRLDINCLCWNYKAGRLINKLLIKPSELSKPGLSTNPDPLIINRIIKNKKLIDWEWIGTNTSENIMDLIMINSHKVNMEFLSKNPSAIKLLLGPLFNSIKWDWFCANPHPDSIVFLSKHPQYINWSVLSSNSSAGWLLALNIKHIVWLRLCGNHSKEAIQIIKASLDKLGPSEWAELSANAAGIDILLENMDKISIERFNYNTHEKAIGYLLNNLDKVHWTRICSNPSAYPIIIKGLTNINYIHEMCMSTLSGNPNPKIIELLSRYVESVNWSILASNSGIFTEIPSRKLLKIIVSNYTFCKHFSDNTSNKNKQRKYNKNLINRPGNKKCKIITK